MLSEAQDPESKGRPSAAPIPRRWAASIALLTFLTYVKTLRFQFVHDDRGQIVGNPAVHSWHAVLGYFSSHVWASVAPTALGNDYRPLFLLWLRINDALFGFHCAGWHFTTVAVHVLATYLVIALSCRIIQKTEGALMAGLIFGLHPVHIEAVAWISGVPESLLACLLIPSYLCWLRSRESVALPWRWLGASLVLYALALLTKETALALLPMIFGSCCLGYPSSPELTECSGRRKLLESGKILLPFILLTILYLVVRMVALKGFSHPAAQISWLTMVLTWPSLILFYCKLLLWPVHLSPFYGLEYVVHPGFMNTIFPAVILLIGAFALKKWLSGWRPGGLAMLWWVCPLLPVLDVQVFGDKNFAHNRYLYLPSVGFSIFAALVLSSVRWRRVGVLAPRQLQLWTYAALALLMGFAIQLEDRYYASDLAFYSFAFARSEDSVVGMDFANVLAEQGNFSQAREVFLKLIRAHPQMWNAYFNLGYMYYQTGQFTLALDCLSRAAIGEPTNPQAVLYRGLANFKLGRIAAAEQDLRRAISLAPAAANYHFALGMVLRVKGDWSQALDQFLKELELNPHHQAAAQEAAEMRTQMTGK
jgi:hypothetical protein